MSQQLKEEKEAKKAEAKKKKVVKVEAVKEEEESDEEKEEAVEAVEESDDESDEEEEVEAETWKERALKAEAEVKRLKAAPVKQVKVKQVCGCCQEAIGRKKSHETTCGHVFHAECIVGALHLKKGLCPTCGTEQPAPVKPVKKERASHQDYFPTNSDHLKGMTDDHLELLREVYRDEWTLKWAEESVPPKQVGKKARDIYATARVATTATESRRLGMWNAEVARAYRRGYITFTKDVIEAPPYK